MLERPLSHYWTSPLTQMNILKFLVAVQYVIRDSGVMENIVRKKVKMWVPVKEINT